MFIESQAMLGAMRELMDRGIPSLTVHDSLIVPVHKREIAEGVLRRHYLTQTGADPVLKVNDPLPSEPQMREWTEHEIRDYDLDAETDGSGDYNQPLGLKGNQEDDDLHSNGDEAQEDDQSSIDGDDDGWGWQSEAEEYTSRNSTADHSKGEYDASETF